MQPPSEVIREFYQDARRALKHELVTFDDRAVQVIADSFARVIADGRYTCYACAIVPDHVHLLMRKHRVRGEVMIDQFQTVSKEDLIRVGLRPADHPV